MEEQGIFGDSEADSKYHLNTRAVTLRNQEATGPVVGSLDNSGCLKDDWAITQSPSVAELRKQAALHQSACAACPSGQGQKLPAPANNEGEVTSAGVEQLPRYKSHRTTTPHTLLSPHSYYFARLLSFFVQTQLLVCRALRSLFFFEHHHCIPNNLARVVT